MATATVDLENNCTCSRRPFWAILIVAALPAAQGACRRLKELSCRAETSATLWRFVFPAAPLHLKTRSSNVVVAQRYFFPPRTSLHSLAPAAEQQSFFGDEGQKLRLLVGLPGFSRAAVVLGVVSELGDGTK